MKQLAGAPVSLTVLTANPTVDVGTPIPAHSDGFRDQAGYVRISVTNGIGIEVVLWVHDASGWSRMGDTGALGLLSGGILPTGVFSFAVRNLGMFDHALLVAQNPAGSTVPTVAATLAMVIET